MPNTRPIRRSQLISPFGVGAMVDFPGDESLMTAGLDEWPSATLECPPDWLVREERLQARLRVNHFRLPPDYQGTGQWGPDGEPAHPVCAFPTVALLSQTRCDGNAPSLRWADEMSLSFWSRLPVYPRRKASLVDSQSVRGRLSKRPH